MKRIIKRDGRKANFDERKIYDAIMQAFGSQNRNEPAKAEEITDFVVASSATHEMAHQRGVARENEANFVSFVVISLVTFL